MNIEIRGKPQFIFSLTTKQTDLLMRCSQLHYDAHCRSYSSAPTATKPPGVLHSWHNSTTNWPGFKITCFFEHLDTCLKILEMPPANRTLEDEQIRSDLVKDFHEALTLANRQYDSWWVTT